ncbi:hypothetical protein [Maricaulis sp.]|uniref:hypothetical protein n=1 Tax=Maricaulis sp. TaxID=1486257 RepID=UPI002618C53B|nr:hypothetical protein [Maricaulis sp.]
MRFLGFLLFLFFAAPAYADMAEARSAYEQGHWQAAAAYAQRAGGADGYAFAAGSLIAQLMVEPDHPDREALARRALELAEYAYELDGEHVEARLRLAGALGFRGRYMSAFRAYVQRMPHRGKRLIEDAVEADPDNAWAVGMLGAWHLEVARRGGQRGLNALDASVEAGIGFYTHAIAMEPENPAPRFFLAVALLALDEPAYYDMAREQVEICLQIEAGDAFEQGIQSEADVLRSMIDDRRRATAWADDRMRR